MRGPKKELYGVSSWCVLALCLGTGTLAAAPAFAQTQQQPTQGSNAAQAQQEIEQVVVTGTVDPRGRRKLDASFSITTADADQIREAAPSSTADLLKIVPGVFAETTGGVSGANVEVRGFPTGGDAPFVSIQIDGSPIYASPTLSFLDNSSLFRLDDTVSRVEVLRGGPSPIWSSGQPGATVNFIQKTGESDPGGSLRLTVGSGDKRRIDLYYGGKISDGWYASIGGFYRVDHGIRNTQYPADDGYQLVGTLVHDIKDGKITVYGRVTHDKNAFFTPIPLVSTNNGRDLHAFPGVDPLTFSPYSNADRIVTIETTPGATPGTLTMDLANGRGVDTHMFGFDVEKNYGDWHFTDKANFNQGRVPTFAIFSGNNPETLGTYIANAMSTANSDPAIVALAGPATSGNASYANSGNAITNMGLEVWNPGFWYVTKDIQSFTNDARISRELFPGNTMTAGVYFADYSSNDTWFLGNTRLISLQGDQPINVTLDNGAQVTLNGIDSGSFYALKAHYNGQNIAGTIADTWQITKQLRVDGGVRFESQSIQATISNASTGNLDGNPLTMYDNNASYTNGTYSTVDNTSGATAWTVGVDYSFSDNLNGFVRVNSGYLFPQFDDFRSGVSTTQRIDQYEVGVKTVTELYSLYLTGFYNKFTGQPQQQILANGTQVNYLLDSRAYGLEFEAALRPIQHFEIELTGDYNHGNYTDGPNNGNQVLRQPEFQFRLTPSYTLPMFEDGFFRIYGTYTYVGDRWADVQNTQFLPSYHTLDFGAELALNDAYEIDVTATNVTNELGITEGNTRVLGSGIGGGGVFLGRPLFGAAYDVSFVVRF